MTNNKLKLIALIIAFTIMGSISPITQSPLRTLAVAPYEQHNTADVVWTANFDDGNLSDWGIYAVQGTIPYTNPPGNFSADDGVLRSNSTGEVFSIANHSSSVAYGTWEFDVHVVDTYNHEIVIPFITKRWTMHQWVVDAYIFQIVTGEYPHGWPDDPAQPRFQFVWSYEEPNSQIGKSTFWPDVYLLDDILGWWHIIITREPDGQFYAYLNGSLILEFNNNRHTTCNEFCFSSGGGPAIDNIVVDDEVTYDSAPPRWDQEPIDQVIEVGSDFRYDLNATDFSGVGTWGLNDTTNFAIDSSGVITNTTALEVGSYGLNVTVSDTLGFTKATVFDVTVQPVESTAQPDMTLYVVTGVTGIVIIVLVAVFMKKRG